MSVRGHRAVNLPVDYSRPFSTARGIRSWLPLGAGAFIQTIRNRLHVVQLRAGVPQQQGYRWPLNTGLDDWRGVIVIVPGPSNGIGYCSRRNLVSVCEGMTAVDGHDDDQENSTNQPISPNVKPVLLRAS
ncbi:hypothetical protein TNCV_712921 [Trichonephila clavipes]|nr:hypothetical protein TNCV_712921 [Trichonephila clavipes]